MTKTTTWQPLIVAVTLLLFISIIRAEIFILRRDVNTSTTELSCYYNGHQSDSVGLAWVLKDNKPVQQAHHERWRHTSRAGLLKGHFEYYGHIWISTTSLNVKAPNIFPPVLDERWNELPEIQTNGTPMVFSQPIAFNTDRLHVSVLASQDAHIALFTDGFNLHNPYNSPTYWIALDQDGASSIRKCVRGMPRSLLARTVDCSMVRAGHKGFPMLKGGKEWVHLTIQMTTSERGEFTIKVTYARFTNPSDVLASLTWTDPNPIRNIKRIAFRTHSTPGKWKLHDYRLVIHNGKDDGEGFNVFELAERHKCCLQLFYYFKEGFGPAVINSKDKTQNITLTDTGNAWKVLKVNMNLNPPKDHVHFLPPIGDFGSTGYVFAISQPFRICGDDEFFISKILAEPETLENAKCMSLKNSEFAVLQNPAQISSTKLVSACPDNKFSKSCNISCGRVVGDYTCQGKVICDKDTCSCLSGYKPTTLWNTTCQESILPRLTTTTSTPGTSNNTTPIPPTSSQEIEDYEQDTEAAIDMEPTGPGEEGLDYVIPSPGSDEDAAAEAIDAEAAARTLNTVCSREKSNNIAVILLSILSCVLVAILIGAAWYWRTQILPRTQAFDVRWSQSNGMENRLIEDDDIN